MSLFDAIEHVRATDPDTSRDAALSIRECVGDQCRLVLTSLLEAERRSGRGATAHEIVMRLAYTGRAPQQSVVARRLTDLRNAGLIEDTGERRPGGSGRNLIVWASTTEGRTRNTPGYSPSDPQDAGATVAATTEEAS